MKIKILQPLILCFAVVLFIGCYKDKGDYNYRELTAFYIDTTGGVKTSYTAQLFEQLEINPKVVYGGEVTNLDYLWKIYPKLTSDGTWQVELSKEKELSATITVAPGTYFLEFLITEKNIGRRAVFRYDLRVEATGSGMLVLYQRDGLTDFGLITPTYLFGNTEEDKVSFDIYTASNPDHPLTGAPVGIGGFKQTTTEFISVFTEDDGVRLSPIDFTITHEYKDLFLFPPGQNKISGFKCPIETTTNFESCDGAELLINDGVYYVNYPLLGGGVNSYYGEKTSKGDCDPAPFFVNTTGRVVIFDRKTSRLMQGSVLSTIAFIRDELGESLDMDVLHLARNSSAWYNINMILKGKSLGNENKRYFYVADVASTYSYTCKWDISSYTGIAQAEVFAFAMRGPVGYYASGNRIYQIKFEDMSGIIGDQAIEMWAGAAGETVTAMEFCPHPGRNLGGQDVRDKYLFVGTWNEGAKEGKVYTFEVNLATDGSLIKTPVAVYSGFGKIKDFAFKF